MAKKIDLLKHVTPDYQIRRGAVKTESSLSVQKVAVAIFDTAGTDSSGVANTTAAAHGTGVFLPTGAILVNAYIKNVTTFTSAASTATIAIAAQTAGDIVAAIAINAGTTPWAAGLLGSIVGNYAERTVAGDTAILAGAAQVGSFVSLTAEREIVVTVGVQALTGGKMYIFVEYVNAS